MNALPSGCSGLGSLGRSGGGSLLSDPQYHCWSPSPLESAGLWFLHEGDLLSCPEVLRVSFHVSSGAWLHALSPAVGATRRGGASTHPCPLT